MCVEFYAKESRFSYRIMYIVILILPPVKEVDHFKWGLIDNMVGFFILPTAVYARMTLSLICVLDLFHKENCVQDVSL